MRSLSPLLLGLLLLLGQSSFATAGVIYLAPAKDNTLIQTVFASATPELSNGTGDLFVGRTNQNGQDPSTISIRRGLIYFDVAASVPAGSTITNVSLSMRDVMGLNGDPVVELHRLTNDWGEGGSFFSGGVGAPPQTDDATWYNRFYNSSPGKPWNTPGGDFSPTMSGSSIISDNLGGGQIFNWTGGTGSQMVADIQDWLNNPAANFGWIMLGDEVHGQTAKRLNSRESNVAPNMAPRLRIEYSSLTENSPVPEPGTGLLACCGMSWLACWRKRRQGKANPSRAA